MPARAGRERAAVARVLRSGLAVEAFALSRVALRRASGTWVAQVVPVWPGYVLAEPASGLDVADVAHELGAAGALSPAEAALVGRLGGAEHVIPVSEGVIEAGRLRVLFGPLAGLESLVQKIDRHRRVAWLEVEPGRRMPVGLEVTSKS